MIRSLTAPAERQGAGTLAIATLGAGLTALSLAGAIRRAAPLALLGGAFVYLAVRRRSPPQVHEVERSVSVRRSAPELYAMWRSPERLAAIADGIGEIRAEGAADGGRFAWSVRLPGGRTVTWAAELVDEHPPDTLTWRTLPGAPVDKSMRVAFRPAPADRGTVVTMRLTLGPRLAVPFGGALLRVLRRGVDLLVDRALRRFQSLAEAGEIPTLEHNPSARARRRAPVGATRGAAVAGFPQQLRTEG